MFFYIQVAILWCLVCLVIVPIANVMAKGNSMYEDFKKLYALSLGILLLIVHWR